MNGFLLFLQIAFLVFSISEFTIAENVFLTRYTGSKEDLKTHCGKMASVFFTHPAVKNIYLKKNNKTKSCKLIIQANDKIKLVIEELNKKTKIQLRFMDNSNDFNIFLDFDNLRFQKKSNNQKSNKSLRANILNGMNWAVKDVINSKVSTFKIPFGDFYKAQINYNKDTQEFSFSVGNWTISRKFPKDGYDYKIKHNDFLNWEMNLKDNFRKHSHRLSVFIEHNYGDGKKFCNSNASSSQHIGRTIPGYLNFSATSCNLTAFLKNDTILNFSVHDLSKGAKLKFSNGKVGIISKINESFIPVFYEKNTVNDDTVVRLVDLTDTGYDFKEIIDGFELKNKHASILFYPDDLSILWKEDYSSILFMAQNFDQNAKTLSFYFLAN